MNADVFAIVMVVSALGFLGTLFVAAHLSWIDKQRGRARRVAVRPGPSVMRPHDRGGRREVA